MKDINNDQIRQYADLLSTLQEELKLSLQKGQADIKTIKQSTAKIDSLMDGLSERTTNV